jgi:outer membrane protein assembly factor BamB
MIRFKKSLIFLLIILILFVCSFISCSLTYEPRINNNIGNISPVVNDNKEIVIDLNNLKREDFNIVTRYPTISDNLKIKFSMGDDLILDQFGLSSISLKYKKINWIKPEYRIWETGGDIVNNKIFCISSIYKTLNCLELKTGKTIWSYPFEKYFKKNSSPHIEFVDNNILIIHEPNNKDMSVFPDKEYTGIGIIQGLNANTGKKIWEFDNKGENCYIFFSNNKVLLTKFGSSLICFNTYSGKQLCKIENDYVANTQFWESKLYSLSNGIIYYRLENSGKNTIHSIFIDPYKGKIIKREFITHNTSDFNIKSLPINNIYKDQIFFFGVSENKKYILTFDLISMKELWRTLISNANNKNNADSNLRAEFTFIDKIPDKIFLSAESNIIKKNDNKFYNYLFCLDRKTGQIDWINDKFNFNSDLSYSKTVDKGYEYITNYNNNRRVTFQGIMCMNLINGKGLWMVKINNGYIDNNNFLGDKVIIRTYKDRLVPCGKTSSFVLINPDNGEIERIFSGLNETKKYEIEFVVDKYYDNVLFYNYWGKENKSEILQILLK